MKKNVFTLIELLIVIAVITVLMSMLLPAISSAKMTAKKIVCMGNMRQVGIANNQYTIDYNDYLPRCTLDPNDNRGNFYFAWLPYFNLSTTFNSKEEWISVINRAKAMKCPAEDYSWLSCAYDPAGLLLSSYYGTVSAQNESAITSLMSGGQWGGMRHCYDTCATNYISKKLSQVTDNSVLLADKYAVASIGWWSLNNWYCSGYTTPGFSSLSGYTTCLTNKWSYCLAYRHNKIGVGGMKDGAVKAFPLGVSFSDNWVPNN